MAVRYARSGDGKLYYGLEGKGEMLALLYACFLEAAYEIAFPALVIAGAHSILKF